MKNFHLIAALMGIVSAFPLTAQPDFSNLSSRQRIAIAEKEQVEAATDTQFQEYMDKGHDLFKDKHYLKAIRSYEKAQDQRPYNVYPKVKITDIELSMKDTLEILRAAEQKDLESQERQKADPSPKTPDYNEETQEERIQKIDDWERKERERRMAERERKNSPRDEVQSTGGDVQQIGLEEYQIQLAKKYPSGVTEETFTEGNKTIVKRVVVRDGKGNEYKRVEHSWGGVFFFKNGDAVTDRVWKSETE